MNKKNIIEFLVDIEDCDEIAEIHIENGEQRDYIAVRYYDEDEVFKMKDGIYKRRKDGEQRL